MTMSTKQIDARMEAYNEVISHLEQRWTEDETERDQGNKLAAHLREKADSWFQLITGRQVKNNRKHREPLSE